MCERQTLFMKFALKALHSEPFFEDEGRNDVGLEADGSTSVLVFLVLFYFIFLFHNAIHHLKKSIKITFSFGK